MILTLMLLVTACVSSGGSSDAYCIGSERAMREDAAIAADSPDPAEVQRADRALRQWLAECGK